MSALERGLVRSWNFVRNCLVARWVAGGCATDWRLGKSAFTRARMLKNNPAHVTDGYLIDRPSLTFTIGFGAEP